MTTIAKLTKDWKIHLKSQKSPVNTDKSQLISWSRLNSPKIENFRRVHERLKNSPKLAKLTNQFGQITEIHFVFWRHYFDEIGVKLYCQYLGLILVIYILVSSWLYILVPWNNLKKDCKIHQHLQNSPINKEKSQAS